MLGTWWQKDQSDIVILGHSKSECQTNGLCSKAAQFAISISYLPLRALRAEHSGEEHSGEEHSGEEHSGEEHISVEIASGTPFRRPRKQLPLTTGVVQSFQIVEVRSSSGHKQRDHVWKKC